MLLISYLLLSLANFSSNAYSACGYSKKGTHFFVFYNLNVIALYIFTVTYIGSSRRAFFASLRVTGEARSLARNKYFIFLETKLSGFMVEFISAPVISGFCSAAALTVASTQIKGLFGLKIGTSSFVEIWTEFFSNISKVNPWDTSLGCSTIILLLIMRVGHFLRYRTKWKNINMHVLFSPQKLTCLKNVGPFKKIACLRVHFVDKTLWFISTSRNAVAVIGTCLAAYFLKANDMSPFSLTGYSFNFN